MLVELLAQTAYGLINTELRRRIWPRLLSIGNWPTLEVHWKDLPVHKDESQIKLDVERSFVFYPPNKPQEQLNDLQARLLNLIIAVLRRNPELSYYQGYHDIAQVILILYDNDFNDNGYDQDYKALIVFETLSLYYLRDFMVPTINSSIDHLYFIPKLLVAVEPDLQHFLFPKSTTTIALPISEPYYAISCIITLFSHHVKSFNEICTIFDYILASKSMGSPIYLYVAMILLKYRSNKQEFNQLDTDSLYSLLTTIADETEDYTQIITLALQLSKSHPLSSFHEDWKSISEFSVLKQPPPVTNVRSVYQKQVDQSNSRQQEKRRHPPPSSAPFFTSDSNLVLGLSICIGVVGIAASLYTYKHHIPDMSTIFASIF